MNKIFVLFFILISAFPVLGQEGFLFEKNVNKVIIPFQFINNLIFIPIKVNGIELNFLLDSGIEETILFSMEDKKEVSFFNVEKITLRGLGSEESIEGLKSTNNVLEINGVKSTNHVLYIVLDQSFNLSFHVGIPVNGIIGYNFFKKNLVEIDYKRKRVIVYRDNKKNRKKTEKKFHEVAITIERSKPYITSSVVMNAVDIPVKLLVDTGNSDAIWLFQNYSKSIKVPVKNFEDYLGKGFSGDVEGKRAQISKFTMSKFEFHNPIVGFPDTTSIRNVNMVTDRAGSVGSEILRRFSVVFDYPNRQLFLKKNGDFYSPFSYNKSGIEIQHYGLKWVQETVHLETVPIIKSGNLVLKEKEADNNFKYKFELKPVYIILNVRKNSPAASSGLQKGDVIVSINKIPAYKYTLQKINSILKSEEEKWITMEIEREGQILKFKFQLLNIL